MMRSQKWKKTMNHFEEIGAKIEEKVNEAISSLELMALVRKCDNLKFERKKYFRTNIRH